MLSILGFKPPPTTNVYRLPKNGEQVPRFDEPILTLRYMDPSISLEAGKLYTKVNINKKIYISSSSVYLRLKDFFSQYDEFIKSNKPIPANPSDFSLNLLTAVGVPPEAFVLDFDEFKLKDFFSFLHIIFIELNKVEPIASLGSFYNPGQISNYWFRYGNGTPMGDGMSDNKKYKIHFFPKPNYIFFVFLTLLQAINQNDDLKNFTFNMKFTLNERGANPRAENTHFLQDSINGGPSPVIIFYLDNNVDLVKKCLTLFLKTFCTVDEEVGLLLQSHLKRVSAFNIRVSNLISYAYGDRGTRLDHRIADKLNGKRRNIYIIPKWILSLQDNCKEKSDDVNRLSQLYFGKDICASTEPINFETGPNQFDDIAYITANNGNILNPPPPSFGCKANGSEWVVIGGRRRKQRPGKTRRARKHRRRSTHRKH